MRTATHRPFHISVAAEHGLCALFRWSRGLIRARIERYRDARTGLSHPS